MVFLGTQNREVSACRMEDSSSYTLEVKPTILKLLMKQITKIMVFPEIWNTIYLMVGLGFQVFFSTSLFKGSDSVVPLLGLLSYRSVTIWLQLWPYDTIHGTR